MMVKLKTQGDVRELFENLTGISLFESITIRCLLFDGFTVKVVFVSGFGTSVGQWLSLQTSSSLDPSSLGSGFMSPVMQAAWDKLRAVLEEVQPPCYLDALRAATNEARRSNPNQFVDDYRDASALADKYPIDAREFMSA